MESDDARDQRHRSSLRGVWRERVRRWHQGQHADRRLRGCVAVTEWRESLGINGNGKDGPTAVADSPDTRTRRPARISVLTPTRATTQYSTAASCKSRATTN